MCYCDCAYMFGVAVVTHSKCPSTKGPASLQAVKERLPKLPDSPVELPRVIHNDFRVDGRNPKIYPEGWSCTKDPHRVYGALACSRGMLSELRRDRTGFNPTIIIGTASSHQMDPIQTIPTLWPLSPPAPQPSCRPRSLGFRFRCLPHILSPLQTHFVCLKHSQTGTEPDGSARTWHRPRMTRLHRGPCSSRTLPTGRSRCSREAPLADGSRVPELWAREVRKGPEIGRCGCEF